MLFDFFRTSRYRDMLVFFQLLSIVNYAELRN